jgi:AcrR family transcriptional regulator
MLEAADRALRGTGAISLETAAKAAGVTKAGLMYHIPTKEALMAAVIDRRLSRYEKQLKIHVRELTESDDLDDATVEQRLAAYIVWTCTGEFDPTDLVVFSDPKLRVTLTRLWVARLEPWLAIPESAERGRHARLLSARLLADGMWFGVASGAVDIPDEQRRDVLTVALELVGNVW